MKTEFKPINGVKLDKPVEFMPNLYRTLILVVFGLFLTLPFLVKSYDFFAQYTRSIVIGLLAALTVIAFQLAIKVRTK